MNLTQMASDEMTFTLMLGIFMREATMSRGGNQSNTRDREKNKQTAHEIESLATLPLEI